MSHLYTNTVELAGEGIMPLAAGFTVLFVKSK